MGFKGVEIFENDFLVHDLKAKEIKKIVYDYGLEISLFQPFRDFEGMPEPYRSRVFDRAKKKFDIIVCNPPYIKSSDVEKLQNEVKNYDPLISLDGGMDGCDSYRAIFKDLRQLLTIDGIGFFEIGYDMLEDIKIILKEFNLKLIRVHKDIQGYNRVIEVK